MNPDIKVILFDLGKTLMFSRFPWPEIFSRADIALFNILEASGFSSVPQFTPDEFQVCLNNYYDQRNIDLVELSASFVLRDFLTSKGYVNVPNPVIRQALDAMYAITQSNWFIEEDTIPTLKELIKRGFRLGLISNAADDRDVQQLVDRLDLRPHFEFILTSAACGRRKPHPLIFKNALTYFSVEPRQAAMVGDTLMADISGAENLGIYSIWLTRHVQLPPDGDLPVQPQAVISTLKELLPLLEEIRTDQ
ncbi:MAG: hypothetical protein A2X25_04545 [Chloroflexi bacterium GWB2_49_20]|nr:MAG: hypothetical protein A2X25_04545 [Chloroflexi bacterium GWB2_49_20]OGN78644.1 MAG: hypothetical protein A2X26_12605 [Chloroflexi bacterium GWC2_49_37]OGN85746.1 MAG: hypothetical protein A2X27_01075 [Chloroflexi bacterium GWD2_49_16]HBG75024.1 hypothetical protein [Anaerolineae bacterium]HCC78050.1 hypothetical protein [Anaerolineae bacterium]